MDKFNFFQKWFWVGIVVSVLSGPAGLVYGLALLAEPEHRKEGSALTLWSLLWIALVMYLVLRIRHSPITPTSIKY